MFLFFEKFTRWRFDFKYTKLNQTYDFSQMNFKFLKNFVYSFFSTLYAVKFKKIIKANLMRLILSKMAIKCLFNILSWGQEWRHWDL